jgi:hypothetical protein
MAGVAEPLAVQGGFGTSGYVSSAQPVAGLGFRIPLGPGQKNCDALMAVDLAQYKLRKAQEMFELGAIDKAQLDAITKKAYQALLD